MFPADSAMMSIAMSFPAKNGSQVLSTFSKTHRVRRAFNQGAKTKFVSAFCQSNCGDVSPNVLGAFCTDTGLPCDFNHSTCNGKNELCYGRGPGYEFHDRLVFHNYCFECISNNVRFIHKVSR